MVFDAFHPDGLERRDADLEGDLPNVYPPLPDCS
jgi:hypothetical protein